jgi:hypothetical protein
MALTREQIIAEFVAERTGIAVGQIETYSIKADRCECGSTTCCGWRMDISRTAKDIGDKDGLPILPSRVTSILPIVT